MTRVAVADGRSTAEAGIAWPVGVVLLGGLAGGAVLAATGPHGPGLSPDSAAYLSVADALTHGNGFHAYGGVQLTDFPPGYPLALAAWLETVGGAAVQAARAVNAICVAGLVVATAVALTAYVRRTALRLAGLLVLAVAPAVLQVGAFAWSESLFCLTVIGCLVFLQRFVAQGRTADLVLAGVFASACIATRWVGVAVALSGVAAVLAAAPRAAPAADVVKKTLVFAGVAAVAPCVWIASRLSVSASPLGNRRPARADLIENARDALSAMGHWFAPQTLSTPLRAIGLAAAAVVLSVAAGLLVRRRPAARPRPDAPLWLPAMIALSLVAATVVGASVTETDRLDARLLAPALPPTVVLVFGAADRLLAARRGRWAPALVAAMIAAWVAVSLAGDVDVWRATRAGDGYAAAIWRNSQLAAVVRQLRPPSRLYSDAPDAAWLLTGRDARCSPPTVMPGPCSGVNLSRGQRRAVQAPAYLVWFRRLIGGEVVGAPTTRGACRVSRVTTTRDGGLFRMTGKACAAS